MTPAEEDAFILKHVDAINAGNIRRVIRAAVAAERERCANCCQMVYDDAMRAQKANGNSVSYYETGRASAADMCRTHIVEGAAAIRRGDD